MTYNARRTVATAEILLGIPVGDRADNLDDGAGMVLIGRHAGAHRLNSVAIS